MYDSIVIGAGIGGSVIARELAERGKEKVLVIEKKDHIGGNCYDENDEYGILIHKYGPHIFHTNNERVFEYLSRYTEWYEFGHKVVADVKGQLIPVPFNLNTLHMVYDQETADRLEKKLVEAYGMESRVPILELMNHEDKDIQSIADYVYKNIFLEYTMKQWGQKPEEIDPSVTGRVPVLISYDDRYFQDRYQGVPKEGFTPMFDKMLDHPGIDLVLKKDAGELIEIRDGHIFYLGEEFKGKVIYTGPIDELFGCRFGRQPYRSLDFVFENHKTDDYQGHSVINYTVSEDYTRITEFKHLTGQTLPGSTTIVKEYPMSYSGAEGQIPYYAIINEENLALYEKYKNLTENLEKFYLLGRLAEYKYYNIDAMADRALTLADSMIG
ncbi:UDP-galactopyranose mutase [Anaerobium acetethylicum]|uniref:UDP-galactopyranose mutase n=1 Tax=Anaerobium acetethylicum TaxID=1619234 RepID=A0A1D3TQT3_9FIRM|nr:UDP-galactopyranose mutase [Anaerobium acetethylicum]SCP96005.1 UDP-galactopyranose mutase [Anaerobium acetethylicum]